MQVIYRTIGLRFIFKGKTLNRTKFEEKSLKYYSSIGWNENGVPTPETLKRLNLMDVETKLKEIGLL